LTMIAYLCSLGLFEICLQKIRVSGIYFEERWK
jgi:hypothetical protein